MLSLLLTLVIGLIVIGLIYYIITVIPLPDPIKQVATVVVVVIACLWLIYVLISLAGGGAVTLR